MARNRLHAYFSAQPEPAPPTTESPWPGFVMVPMANLPGNLQQAVQMNRELYEQAFRLAQENCAPQWWDDDTFDYSI